MVLVEALQKIFKSNNEIKVLGTRHGEKKYETLLSREEMIKAKDLGEYFSVPADTRDLNYSLYFEQGDQILSKEPEYNSDNTKQLDVDGMVELLLTLDYVKNELEKTN
jgi:UDP-glucose 4-epimerase